MNKIISTFLAVLLTLALSACYKAPDVVPATPLDKDSLEADEPVEQVEDAPAPAQVEAARAPQPAPVAATPPRPTAQQDVPEVTLDPAIGTGFINSMASGDFTRAMENFNEKMKTTVSAQTLQQTWQALVDRSGAFKKTGEPRQVVGRGRPALDVPMEFENATHVMKVLFDTDGKIASMWLEPSR